MLFYVNLIFFSPFHDKRAYVVLSFVKVKNVACLKSANLEPCQIYISNLHSLAMLFYPFFKQKVYKGTFLSIVNGLNK